MVMRIGELSLTPNSYKLRREGRASLLGDTVRSILLGQEKVSKQQSRECGRTVPTPHLPCGGMVGKSGHAPVSALLINA